MTPRLSLGDPAPVFVAPASNNPRFVFDTAAGRYLVLAFVESGAADDTRAFLDALARLPCFNDSDASLFIISPDPRDQAAGRLPLRVPGIRAFFDTDRSIARLYGIERFAALPALVVVSPRLQVLMVSGDMAPDRLVQQFVGLLRRLPSPRGMPDCMTHAPVLLVPYVFERSLCRALIDAHRKQARSLSGFMQERDGLTVGGTDPAHKIRRDYVLEDQDLIDAANRRITRRIVPEISKAFQFNATLIERYLVGCYDAAEGGHFRAHRDNKTKGTAHRRFAISINLNADEYEGGDLCFPEFGWRTYRPPTGGAVVFSCSLLHQATKVTKGCRYAFLPFLYDEAAQQIRKDNLQYLSVGPAPAAPETSSEAPLA